MATQTDEMRQTGSVLGYQAKFVDVDGYRTRYYDVGQGDDVMVMVHGALFSGWSSANTWTPAFEGLSKRFRILAPDKLGAGMTDNPKSIEEYTQHHVAQHIFSFIQTMGVEKFHIAGQSNGGYTAARIALEHPDMCKSLILVDSATLGPAVGDISERRGNLFANAPTDMKEYIRFHWGKMGCTQDDITDEYVDAGYFMESQPKSQQTYKDLEAGGTEANRSRFPADKAETHEWVREGRLTMPVLVSWGYNDPSAILPVGHQLFDMICENTEVAEMHIWNHVGHFHYREIPEHWTRLVADFIDRRVK